MMSMYCWMLFKGVRAEGFKITEVMTPFPVHGLDEAMVFVATKLYSAGFLFGATGTLTALVSLPGSVR